MIFIIQKGTKNAEGLGRGNSLVALDCAGKKRRRDKKNAESKMGGLSWHPRHLAALRLFDKPDRSLWRGSGSQALLHAVKILL